MRWKTGADAWDDGVEPDEPTPLRDRLNRRRVFAQRSMQRFARIEMKVDGACLCGSVTYEAEIDPGRVVICHCADCQINSGSAYGVVASVTDGKFHLITGQLKEYEKTAASGRARQLSFCPECGTRIHARTKSDPTAFFGLRVGTIRQRAELKPQFQVWCGSALPWVLDLSPISRRVAQGE